MPSAVEDEIRSHLAAYVTGALTLDAFTDWFIPKMWQAQEGGDEFLARLTAQIDLRLIEHGQRLWTEPELKELLAAFLSEHRASDLGGVSHISTI